MRAFQAFLQLPISLLVTSFALEATTAPIEGELKYLTPDNFKSTIAKGVWFIEHFSPYCHHCRDFAPTWSKLIEDSKESSDPGIQFAQVNCVVYGDLCEENKITAYPQLNLYRDGEFVDTFSGTRDYDVLQDYIKKHAEPTLPSASMTIPVAVEAPTMTKPEEVLHVQTSRADVNPSGSVLPLGPSNFQEVIDQGPAFIKFFAPWCGHCKKLAPTWTQLARHMQHKLNVAEVNCEDYSALCKGQDVTGYPMLVYYANGAKTEYTGSRKFELLKNFTEKAATNAVEEIRVEHLEEKVRDHPVVYLLIYAASDSRTLNEITQASRILLGSVPIYTSSSPELFTRFGLTTSWALLVLKDYDTSSPTAIYHNPNSDIVGLTQWLLTNRIPTTVELSQENFQQVMNAPHKPLVVIVAVSKSAEEKVSDKVKEIGKKWRVSKSNKGKRDVVFTWMDADKWASWLKNMYGIKGKEGPVIVIADHSSYLYYDKDQQDETIKLTSPSIFATIDGIIHGSITPKHSENFAERLSRSLNAKLTSLEAFVINKPLQTISIVVIVLVLVFLAAKRAIADDVADLRQDRHTKSRRLD
jgi:thioredoxin domain-containing protein 5